jgi:hypothetical protein
MSEPIRDRISGRTIRPFHRTENYVWAFTYREKDEIPVLHSLRIKRIRIRRTIVVRVSKGDNHQEELWRSAKPS